MPGVRAVLFRTFYIVGATLAVALAGALAGRRKAMPLPRIIEEIPKKREPVGRARPNQQKRLPTVSAACTIGPAEGSIGLNQRPLSTD